MAEKFSIVSFGKSYFRLDKKIFLKLSKDFPTQFDKLEAVFLSANIYFKVA